MPPLCLTLTAGDNCFKLFLIDKITDVYDEGTGEIVKEVTGVEGGVEKSYRTYPEFDKSALDGLSRGDIEDIPYYDGNGQYAVVIMRYRSRSPQEIIVIK